MFIQSINFRRLQRQIEGIKRTKDPQHEKVVERISVSENEKEVYNKSNVSLHNISTNSSSNNEVYRYFTQSAKLDTDLFNYKKYFSDILLDHVNTKHERALAGKVEARVTAVALKPAQPKDERIMPKTKTKNPEIDNCPSCSTHAECSRCHKKLEMFCKDCNKEHAKPPPEATNRLQIEDNAPDLPFSTNQQVVVYRPSEEVVPYSFNVEPNSRFYRDTMKDMRSLSEMKIANYIKLYGDMRRKKIEDVHISQVIDQAKRTGAIPKRRPALTEAPNQNLMLTPSKTSSDLEDILSRAENTVLTQVGFARKLLEMEKLKL
jgi:hypothetical protein